MHNYNVLSKYKHQTRIGNWSEEWELEETRMKDYLKDKDNQNLVSIQKENNMDLSLQQADLTKSEDQLLRFGDNIMLFNGFMQSFLACDLSEKLSGFDESYSVTCAQNIHPCNRSVFQLVRYEKEKDQCDGNTLHYGQKFRILVNSNMTQKKLYLTSYAIQPQKYAKFSRFQEVSMSYKDNIDTVWEIEHADPKVRFESKGQEVKANEPILVKHVLTQQWLGSDKVPYKNQYGSEYEVFGHSFQKHNKTQVLIAEKGGRTTIDIPCRNQNNQNTWCFVTAP